MGGAVVPAEMKFRGFLSHCPAKDGLFQVMKVTLSGLQHHFRGTSSSLPLHLKGDRGAHQGPLPADRSTWRNQNLMMGASCWDRNLPGFPALQQISPALLGHHQLSRQLQLRVSAASAQAPGHIGCSQILQHLLHLVLAGNHLSLVHQLLREEVLQDTPRTSREARGVQKVGLIYDSRIVLRGGLLCPAPPRTTAAGQALEVVEI
mmetsp:Transcript_56364/g.91700  ORF Transcript_56364/g.91700 Transcript_56364/m.91700 type:complete len:205 (+) Transcript_56364:63-677(+)